MIEAYLNRDAIITENLQAAHLHMQREGKFAVPHISSDVAKRDEVGNFERLKRARCAGICIFLRIY